MASRDLELARKAFKDGNVDLLRQAHKVSKSENAGNEVDEDEELWATEKYHHNEEHSKSGDFIKSAVYGGLDGMITTFSVVMASEGASLTTIVVLTMGIANLIGDGISMALGDYLSSKAE